MNEFRGTKGKWSIDYNSVSGETNKPIVRSVDASRMVCMLPPKSPDTEANALLISKCPEMLQELKDVIEVVERLKENPNFNDIGGHFGSMAYRCKQLIKEATKL